MHIHTFPKEDLDYVIRVLGEEVEGEKAIHVTIT